MVNPFTVYARVKRAIDVVVAVAALTLLALPSLAVAFAVRVTSKGPVLYWSKRFGSAGHLFWMPKFRTMLVDTPEVATHLLSDPTSRLTPIGGFLRKSSLDEIPQLWCILRGEMTLVGPRPALFNQKDLIELRKRFNVHLLTPGLTGWAQVNGRDSLSVQEKVEFENWYQDNRSLQLDARIVLMTILRVLFRRDVAH